MSLHKFLTRLIWLCVLPLVLLAVYLAIEHVRKVQNDVDKDAVIMAKNFAMAIDHNLDARISALQLLALSPLADEASHRQAFYRAAQGVALPTGWSLALLDGTGQAIARTGPPDSPARPGDESAKRFVVKSSVAPWSVVLDIPRNVYLAPLFESAAALALTILGATLASVVGGQLASRRLAQSVASLAGTAAPRAQASNITELATVGRLLDESLDKRDKAELERRGSEKRFRAIFEQAAAGIALIAPDGRWLLANQKLCDTVGYPRDELLSKTSQGITHPDDLPADVGYLRQMLAGEVRSCSMEKRYIRKDGATVWINQSIALVRDPDGTPDYFIALMEDIQRRKEAEAALQASEDALQEAQRLADLGSWSWDLRTDEHVWSEGMYRIYGRDPALAPAVYPEVLMYFTPDSWRQLETAVVTGRTLGTPVACDVEVVRAGGTRRWVTVQTEAKRDAAGTVVLLHGTVQDITERKLAESEIDQHRNHLEQLVTSRTAELSAALADSTASHQHLQVEIQEHHDTEARLYRAQVTLNQAARMAQLGAWSFELQDLENFTRNSVTWSAEMYRLLDYTPQEVPVPTPNAYFARVHPDDRQRRMDTVMQAMMEKGAWQAEYRLITADGSERLVVEMGEFAFDESGQATAMLGAVKDITLQRRVENQLRDSEARLRMTLEGAGAGSYEWDSHTDTAVWSDELWALLGLEANAGPAGLRTWRQSVHPDDRERIASFIQAAVARGAEYEVEWRVNLPPDVAPRWLLGRARAVLDAAGQVLCYRGIVIDISKRRQAELTLELYRGHLEERVAERTAELTVAEAEQRRLNRSLRLHSACSIALIHAKNEDQLLRDLCRLVVEVGGYLMAWIGLPEQDATKSIRLVAEYGDKTGYQSNVTQPLISGHQVLGALSIFSPEPRDFGIYEVDLLEGLADDMAFGLQALRTRGELARYQQQLEARVTERTQEIAVLNAALTTKARDAESANLAKSSFLATMSHELRTPLNAVVGLTGLLAHSALNRRQRDYADKIELSAQALRALMDNVLDFSRIEAGELRLEQAPFLLNTILRTTAAVVGVGLGSKAIEALFEVAPDVPDALIGDALRLQQILLNLTSNAVKFTTTGVIVISVRCLAHGADQVTLQIAVRDSGIGMLPEQLGRIFDSFTQADASTSRLYGGSGLGLAISARLAQLMGGRIDVDSTVDWGSEFRLEVPLTLGSRVASAAAAIIPPGLSILIVDDHGLARDILTQTCTAFGWQITAVDSGVAGLAELRRSAAEDRDYDLMLLDWRMPGMDGLEMLRQAYATPDIGLPLVVLMVSVFELELAAVASDELNLDGIAAKPMTPASLLEVVSRAYSGEFATPLAPAGKADRRLAGMRLLVAEDNELNQEVIEQVLTRAGAEVVIAANGLAAVTALRVPGAHFDAVLMDIQMPLMDGYAATRVIRQELGRIDLPIIAVTAFAQPEDRQKSRLAGMVGHLVKPIDVEDLLDLVAQERQGSPPKSRATPDAAEQTPTPALQLPGLNVGVGLQTFGGDQKKYGEILRKFIVRHGDNANEARRLFNTDDADGAARLLHDLSGMASLLQATELARLTATAEGALRNGSTDALALLFDELQAAMHTVETSVDQLETLWISA